MQLMFDFSMLFVNIRFFQRKNQKFCIFIDKSLHMSKKSRNFAHFFACTLMRTYEIIKIMRKIGFIVLLTAFALSTFAAPARGVRRPIMQAVHEVGRPNPIPRVVVILVSYSDLAIQSKNTAQALDSLFNITGYAFNGATGSARDYFIAQSDSAYQPIFDVFGPVTLSNNRAYYGAGNPDKRPGDMIKEACTLVDDQVNFADYDSDGDGKVDCVYVLYAGIGANDVDGEADAIWPHQSTVYGLTLDGKQISTYACSGEIDGYLKNRTCIGPICHEFGHAIGMPDYYSTGPSNAYIVCEWSAMDHGMYNNDANTPPNYSIFDKEYMGWTSVEELKADSQATITLTTDYGDGYKMNAGGAMYYIENRQKTGWDLGLPGSGMLVWQVKFNQSTWSSNHVNYTNTNPSYTVLSARYGPMTNGDQVWSSSDDPFPGTWNVTGWTAGEGLVLTDIAETNGQITFKLNGGKPTGLESQESRAESRKIMRDGQLIILRGGKAYNAQGMEIR